MARTKSSLYGLRAMPIGTYIKFLVDSNLEGELRGYKQMARNLAYQEGTFRVRVYQIEEGSEGLQALYIFKVATGDDRGGQELFRLTRLGKIQMYDRGDTDG